MKKRSYHALAVAILSCSYLTQCTPHQATQSTPLANQGSFAYPPARTHQDSLDPFLHGEVGMSANTAANNHALYERATPDDGIDRYAHGTHTDKYRWLENYDPIDPRVAYETTADRERNNIGSLLEDDRPLAQTLHKSLSTVAPKGSSEVNDWVNAQNTLTQNYLNALPFYAKLKANADSLLDYDQTISSAKRKGVGEIRLYRHADGSRRIERIAPDGTRTELINERHLSPTGKSSIRSMKVSKDGTYVAFFAREGSADADKRTLHVIDSKTGALVTPIIQNIDRSNPTVAWLDDETFWYGMTDKNKYRQDAFSRTIGKERFLDDIMVTRKEVDDAAINSISFAGEDKRYVILETWDSGDSVYIKDRQTGKTYRLHDQDYLNDVFRYNTSFNNNILAKLVHFDPKTRDVWIISGENDRRGEIIKTNLDNLKKREVVVPMPEGFDLLRDAYYHEEGSGYFLTSYLKDGTSRVLLIDATTGTPLKELTPQGGVGYASDFDGNVVGKDNDDSEPDDSDSYAHENYVKFRYTSPTTPETDYKYSIAKDTFLDIRRHDLSPFNENDYETKLVFYTAKDGTKIPMNISHKKGIVLDGNNPTLLYGYGGYGVIYEQMFGLADPIWLENGGVWAHAFIRGGGEYGDDWQNAAKHTKRLTGYDDFAAAADYLNTKGYAKPDRLGIIGGSNGGLLVGAAMVRNPDKYRVAFPQVAVLDQFRHEKMGITQYWMEEYGTPEESRQVYDTLLAYSPYHNLHQGVCYPATLVQTSKRDDRVVPSHSYKFIAALQEVQSCDRPAFLFASDDQGHSPNTYLENKEDSLKTVAFALSAFGVRDVPTIAKRPSPDELKTDMWRAEEARLRQRQAELQEQNRSPSEQ